MKSTVIGCLAAAFLLVFGLAAITWGEETPGAPAGGTKAAAKEPKKAVDKTEKVVAAIKEQVAWAEKLVQQAAEEMAKPDKQRDAKKAYALKTNAAKTYLAAALNAFNSAPTLFSKEEEKQVFLAQYDMPNREKAIALFLELAAAAQKEKRYPDAIALYKDVLQIDPKNTTATEGIKKAQDPGGGKRGPNPGRGR
ncbi:MAG: hypothetical protein NTX87_20925 [Planctomycetota bacterium]|nr:hypothetical protein [Planctomycetota bacterium]